MTILLAEGSGNAAVVSAAGDAFLRVASRISQLIAQGATAEVDIGLFVTAQESQSIQLAPALLSALEEAGVSLVVSAYPTSD